MARTTRGVLALLLLLGLIACTTAGDVTSTGLISDASCDGSLMEPRVARNLLGAPNGDKYTDKATGYVYTIFGFNDREGNAVEAIINCSRLGQEQPDISKPGDVFAVKYLSANYATYVKTQPGAECTVFKNGEVSRVLSGNCEVRQKYMCVLRKPLEKCGKGTCAPGLKCCGGTTCCCASSTCCGGAICCHTGTKCCLGKLGAAPACKAKC